ncbi:MAG TPA: DUF1992 domain-containing protein [Mycobacteriales bacterium]|nr:DUF1992 domain-containing protein [Mycobacteriales bacterium]
MSERKPPGVKWESWIDQQIRDAESRGAFEDLPGKGKPIEDLDQPLDELWWVRRKLRDEGVSFLPPALAIRRELEATRPLIAAATSEDAVRRLVEDINTRIREVNRRAVSGPPTTVMPLDLDEELTRWRAARPAPVTEPEQVEITAVATEDSPIVEGRQRKLRWLLRRR